VGFSAQAQNTPVLTETAPPGTVTEIQVPFEPHWGPILIGQGYPAYPSYIKNYVPMTHIGTVSQLGVVPLGAVKLSFAYKDGFNATFQTVTKNFSRQGSGYNDLVGVSETLPGKEEHGFLPFSKGNNFGNDLYENALGTQKSYYAANYPQEGYTSYSQSSYTSDATKRQTEKFAPGRSQVGQKKGAVTVMGANDANAVRTWDVNAQGWPVTVAYYGARQLAVATTTLADNSRSLTFTDKSGNVVLRQLSDTKSGASYTYASTYYVYDELGRLRYVLPPKAVAALEGTNWALDTVLVNGLCFQYRYDEKGRMYAKRNPGEDAFTEMSCPEIGLHKISGK